MNYLLQLTDDEIRYICSVIPTQDTIAYFQHNPKEFSKILPGFRASAISKLNVSKLLFNYRNRGFISSFLDKHINDWLSQIQEHFNNCMGDGDSKELALFHTLPLCFFADNIALYFKLINEEYSEDYIATLNAAVKAIKESDGKQEKLQEELEAKESEIQKLQIEYELEKTGLESTCIKLNERSAEIKTLKRSISDLEKLKTVVQDYEGIIASLKSKIQEQEGTLQKLRTELTDARDNSKRLEEQIKAKLEKQQATKIAKQQAEKKPKCPNDIEEFKDYLGYNLESIGIPADSRYCALLKEHVSKILFQGIPVVVNRNVGITLMKCVANALIGQSNVKTLAFSKTHSIEDIGNFLSFGGRVVCLDNFIGNFNETELLSLFDDHRDKIIFLTVAYDRTIHYVSEEFLRYCQYLNLNRIAALSVNAELTEDPSIVEEVESKPQGLSPDNRYSSILRELLVEFGLHQSLIEQKCAAISGERDLCRVLAFDILPYCVDVLQIAPYNTSERFLKYAGDNGRCLYKNLFREWFV
ncbi:MAG TPA: hypothetical protein VM577_13625 [Anaerovoracaceae bacterium]|nr:hypothetical protein [Anaerovoracaceae bacterium]